MREKMASSRGVDGQNCKTDIMGMGLQDTPASIDMKSTDTARADGMASQPAATVPNGDGGAASSNTVCNVVESSRRRPRRSGCVRRPGGTVGRGEVFGSPRRRLIRASIEDQWQPAATRSGERRGVGPTLDGVVCGVDEGVGRKEGACVRGTADTVQTGQEQKR